MAILRSEVTTHTSDDVPRDYATNTVYHEITGVLDVGTDYQNHADQIFALFTGADPTYPNFDTYKFRTVTVNVYDMSDALPRPVRATHTQTPTPGDDSAHLAPRQVALCLSYYSDRNLPSERGHIYVGPFVRGDVAGSRPTDTTIGKLIDLGHGLFDIGGENCKHVIHSRFHAKALRTTPVDFVVHHYWVDDSWDIIRRRKDKASKRVQLAP